MEIEVILKVTDYIVYERGGEDSITTEKNISELSLEEINEFIDEQVEDIYLLRRKEGYRNYISLKELNILIEDTLRYVEKMKLVKHLLEKKE